MSQSMILKNSGLETNANQLSAVSEGALTIANNINIDKDDIAESRRGFMRLENAPADDDLRNTRITSYQDKLMALREDGSLAYYNAGWTDLSGVYDHPDADYARMQFLQASSNLYFTTNAGVKVLDVYSGPVYSTGMPRGLDGSGATTGASGFMTTNTQVAYRVLWGSRDANNNLYLGTPSQRYIVANTSGGTRDVSLTFTIPAGIATGDFFQVYRSKESATSTDEPNDELLLVYEKNPTAGEILAKSITFTDSTPTSLMGAYLYTNASQEGLQESNDEPPLAKDIALYKNYTFFAGVKSKQALNIKLLAVSGSGLVNDDTITIDSVVFTGKGAETIASGYFKVSTGGSAAQNIADTAQSLVKVINQYSSNTTVYAYYMSGYQDLPGQIMIVDRTLSDSTFSVTTSKAAAFDRGTGTSSNDDFQAGLMWSKDGQPEHVPALHIEFVGSKNYPIRRIVALRDSLFILKTDGVYRLTGSAGKWSITALDTSTRITAPDSVAVVNNQIFCLADQGIVAISDVGVQVMSRPIEDEITELISQNFTTLKTLSYGIAYETDRKYILNTITLASDAYCTKAFVYNTFTQSWTAWVKDSAHGFLNPADDKLYLCNPEDKHVLRERKSLDFTDFADEELDGFSVVSSSNYDVVLNSVTGLAEGYLLWQDASTYSVITAIDEATNTVTVHNSIAWTVASIVILKNIECTLEYVSQHFKNPGVMKQFQETALLFRETNFLNGIISYFTDLSGGYSSSDFAGQYGGSPWGLFGWNRTYWGGLQRAKPIRTTVPREKSRGTLLTIKLTMYQAYSKWSLNGISCQYEWVSERVSRS